ncbi:carbonic anhydrase [Limnobaculum zhutongyuii]|uniref:carbonic anhydrase n=1 Tax=Limnobaculum zhutongyuii TaxID=2498113 RepID=A0A411WG46_9GAMM|nr:carbonic anhydrase [Limnobaculum zhutongyuii]QBH94977.1 carbonic anhydrase [Limnobaculum zhutongyuii]TQS87684.1 carbonic anhydrase [Limnobaculum zhutongyuii]
MKTFIAVCGLALSFSALASPHWEYSGEAGPEHWAELAPEFAACHAQNQSPVNLTGTVKSDLKPFHITYAAGAENMVNNGHTLQVNYAPGSKIDVDGMPFELKQFHFHTPGENQIEGKSFPMEIHFVHANSKGELTVLAVMVKEGKANPTLAKLWKEMPKTGETVTYDQKINAKDLLPANLHYYRFSGSLTTPPCTEGVRWLVLKNQITASHEQIQAFTTLMGHPNNRPVQPINAREVLKD